MLSLPGLVFAGVFFCCFNCGRNEHSDEPSHTFVMSALSPQVADELEVKVHGNLRQVMHAGTIGAAIELDTLFPGEHVFGVGALADLQGEVTIVDGVAYLSYPDGEEKARTKKLTESSAAVAMLVSAKVTAWQTMETEQEILFVSLDEEIAKMVTAVGLDVNKRIPFRIEGEFRDLRWHVIDGSRLPDGSSSHEDHVKAAVNLTQESGPALLVGFFSKNDGGVFTQMRSHTHIHCVIAEPLSSGHVDHVIVPAGTKVMFPVIQRCYYE